MENYHFLEKVSHFDRERIPERVVHARGFVAHGSFEAYGTIGDQPAATYTRAKLFSDKGKRTPSPFGSPPSSAAGTPPRWPATRAGSPSSSAPRPATGTWSGTT
jgi:hypothetical protein